ncbi:hypothetical protein ACROYT_G007763 [Oculina patagonica]
MGFFDGNHTANAITGSVGKEGPAGVGFKLTDDGNYDMDKKKIFGLKTQDDVAFDADLDTYAKDLSSAVNKRYVNQFLMKKNSDETHFDCVGLSLQNTEAYYDGLYNDLSIPNVEYVKLEDNKVKTELNNKLTDKADLSTNNEQTFNSIINVPKFDSGYSNMSNVMNKEYIDSRNALKADKTYADNTFLTKKTGAILANTLQSKVSKIYADSTFLTKAVGNGLAQSIQNRLNIHGSNMMEANLDMGGYNITHLKTPSNNTDAVNKKYMLDYVGESHVQSANGENKFKYIMDDPNAQVSEEDDVELGNVVTFQNSPHKMSSIGLTVIGTVVGSITLNPIVIGCLTGSGVLIHGYITKSNISDKVNKCKFAYTSYEKVCIQIKCFLRGLPSDENAFLTDLKVLDDIVIDQCPTVDEYVKKYYKKFTSE